MDAMQILGLHHCCSAYRSSTSYIQCLQSSRSQVGGSNPDSSVEEKFQKTLNPWTGRSQLPPETFKFELQPVWWGAGSVETFITK